MSFMKSMFNRLMLQREIIRKFREIGAFSVDFAKPLEDMGIDKDGLRPIHMTVINKLIKKGVFVSAGNKTYFLDERALMRYRMSRTKWAMLVLFVILILFILKFIQK